MQIGTTQECPFSIRVRAPDPAQLRTPLLKEPIMRYLLLWILGVPIPVLILIWLLWGH